MTLQDIKLLNLPSDTNCILYLWATAPKLLEALEVMDAWGFTYKTQAIWNKEIIGMALIYYRFSTWKGRTIHMEDLIVKEKMRNKGVGKALYSKVIAYAYEKKVKRIEWAVLDWNKGAIRFYERSGAKVMKNWYITHMEESGIKNYIATL